MYRVSPERIAIAAIKTAGTVWSTENVVILLVIRVLMATGRQEYGPKVSNIVTHVYIVDAMTPVRMANINSRPWGGRYGPSSERKNQIMISGIRNEKSVWPITLPLR
jgi:hypothetical protein